MDGSPDTGLSTQSRRLRPKLTVQRVVPVRTGSATWILARVKRNVHLRHLRKKRRDRRGKADQMRVHKAHPCPLSPIPHPLCAFLYLDLVLCVLINYTRLWRLSCICIHTISLYDCKRSTASNMAPALTTTYPLPNSSPKTALYLLSRG